ncbi:MAG: type IV pilin biogenesis protein [Acidithiobacillus sp.]|nr:type IV pilin biogenesis protein [Acidithiobacillus sp.]
MKQRTIKRVARKGLAIVLALGINLLPLQGLIPVAQASGGLNIPTKDQPQVLIILDNSQGMAGVLQATQGYATSSSTAPTWSTNLSGAIMTGSGTVPQNQTSSSPAYYTTNNFTPPALGSAGARNQFTVSCGSSGLTAAAVSACATISNNGYVDNSPSMLNGVEVPLANILATPLYANNIQFGLEDYLGAYTESQTKQGTYLYNTYVYYMSSQPNPYNVIQTWRGTYQQNQYTNDFSFGTSATSIPNGYTAALSNPCYQAYNSTSCTQIQNWFGQGAGSISDPYLYVYDTSDNPVINDVLYTQGSSGSNFISGSFKRFSNNYSQGLSAYENQIINNSPIYSYYPAISLSPTSAGYIASSYDTWFSQRGLAFNNNALLSDQGNMVVPIQAGSPAQLAALQLALSPEVFSNSNIDYASSKYPISASAGYSPVAGAFQTAIDYYSGSSKQISNSMPAPPTTCGKKYVIFITDGQPTMGTSGHIYPPLGSASAQSFGMTQSPAVAEAISNIQTLANEGITTYILGVGSAVDPDVANTTSAQQAVALQGQAVLNAMAQAGGTSSYYSANSQAGVQAALNSIVANILGKSVVSSYAAPPTVGPGSLEFLLKNVNPVTGQGDLYAYQVTSTGAASSSASWTANGNMTAATRSTSLFTTPLGVGNNNSGPPQTFSSVASTNSAAFAITTTNLTASDIANYTTDPSYSNGQYLGGRQSGWYVGLPANLVPAQVLVPPYSASLLSNAGYLAFASSHASRQNAVLFADNDGFLYALGYNNTGSPTLLWGWMPGGLLSSLQNYQAFWQGNNMGAFSTIDAYNGKHWHTYVVGVANNGGIIYDLQLSGTTSPGLKSVVSQYVLSGYSQPQPSAPVYYQVQTSGASNFGTTWALFALNTSSGSYLGVLNVGTGASYLDPLPFTNTATPYIDASGNLFLGDSSGNVYEMSNSELLSVLTAKNTVTNLSISNDFTEIGNYAKEFSTALQTNVQFIGGTYYQGANYLRVQGPSGITLFKQINNVWSPVWTAYAGGAGSWSGGTYTAQSGSVTSNSISPLPPGSTISDQALISGGNVIVPVTVPAPAKSCGSSTAVYYIYGLSNGVFPSGAFVSSSGTAITQGFIIGRGSAYTPSVSTFNGHVLLQSAASQNSSGKTSGFATVFGAGLPLGGPVAWRLVLTQ